MIAEAYPLVPIGKMTVALQNRIWEDINILLTFRNGWRVNKRTSESLHKRSDGFMPTADRSTFTPEPAKPKPKERPRVKTFKT